VWTLCTWGPLSELRRSRVLPGRLVPPGEGRGCVGWDWWVEFE
jgi:hypothetical protein